MAQDDAQPDVWLALVQDVSVLLGVDALERVLGELLHEHAHPLGQAHMCVLLEERSGFWVVVDQLAGLVVVLSWVLGDWLERWVE